VFRELRAWSPKAVLLYGYAWSGPGAVPLLLALKACRVPVVFRGTLHTDPDPRSPRFAGVKRRLKRRLFRLFDSLHYGGSYSRRVFEAANIPAARLFLVPFSVDSTYFVAESDRLEQTGVRRSVRTSLGIGETEYVILFIGQLSWQKGADIAIEVFARSIDRVPSARLVVLGSGPLDQQLREEVRHRGLDKAVSFQGFCPTKQTVPYYLASDVVLFTSRYETWARAVNEAMLCKRPCILNAAIPAADLIEHGSSGYIVPPGDVAAYVRRPDVAAYVRCLEQHSALPAEQRVAIGEAARRSACGMSYENHVDALVESFRFAWSRSSRANSQRSQESTEPVRFP
jgi:glycosyltransferase involved in cell wall biosynthesis